MSLLVLKKKLWSESCQIEHKRNQTICNKKDILTPQKDTEERGVGGGMKKKKKLFKNLGSESSDC